MDRAAFDTPAPTRGTDPKTMPRPVQPPTCASCGYDLSGVPIRGREIRCPECGGNRVRMYRWYEPRTTRPRALLYLPAAALAAVPGVFAVWLLVWALAGPRLWPLAASIPYAGLGVGLSVWRPGAPAGVTVLGLGSVVAFPLGVLLVLAMPMPTLVLPLGVLYLLAPPVLGPLWAHAVLGDP